MPITFLTTMIARGHHRRALTSGFYSKDQVLAAAFEHGGVGLVAWAVGVLTAGLTAFYMSRYVFLTSSASGAGPRAATPTSRRRS